MGAELVADMNAVIVETEWLAERLGEPDLVVVDCSWHLPATGRDGRGEYLAGHIPGAVFLDIDEVADHDSGLPHTLPSPSQFAAAMAALGIGEHMRIVMYDADGLFSAARGWWMLRIMGAGNVAILNGGQNKWKAEGRALEDGMVDRAARDFTVRFDPSLIRNLEDMRTILDQDHARVIDCRSPGRFAGAEPEPREGVRAGHMPGALNLHYALFANPDGTMKDDAALADLFAMSGIDIDQPVVATCGSGVTAAIAVLALARLGHGTAAVYDGSWSEWGAAKDTPVVTGAD